MNDYMRALHQRFFREPDVSVLEEDIENTRQEVRDCLNQMQRRRLMHLVDSQNLSLIHIFPETYHFSAHSLLSSAIAAWPEAPTVLLREHYRCHPKIINFCNQKFYGGKLIVMTEDHEESDVLTMYRTAPGNHARGHLNQRQIDVIRQEVLPSLERQGYGSCLLYTSRCV